MGFSPMLSQAVMFSLLLIMALCCRNFVQVVHGDEPGLQSVAVESLKPETVCSAPKDHGPNSLKLVPGYGPCSVNSDKKPDHLQILADDALRIASIGVTLSSFDGAANASGDGFSKLVSLPTQGGGGGYFVTIGLGTPSLLQTVLIDTGSSVCWVQCKPCLQQQSCYPQKESLFDPSASSTYSQIPCTSNICKVRDWKCGGDGQCRYHVEYGDKSYTDGILATENLTLTTSTGFSNFVFGCGDNNGGLFKDTAGLFGLGRSPFSLVSQTASRLGNIFSYCLPSTSSSTGHLTLGRSSNQSQVYYTPMLNDPNFYVVDLIGISVAGVRLPLEPTVFRTVGTILDSGTTITYLPPAAYSVLKSAFSSVMLPLYRQAQPFGPLDTCFDFTGVTNIRYPPITLHYDGVDVRLPGLGTFYPVDDISQVCLAFASSGEGAPSIIGNVQQKGFEVIHDIDAQRIGFAIGTCG